MSDSAHSDLEMLADVLGCKWMIQILQQLEQGPRRPSQIRRAVPGISEKVLTERLRHLEQAGLIQRHDYGVFPRRVDYRLTERGAELRPLLDAIREFCERSARRRRASGNRR